MSVLRRELAEAVERTLLENGIKHWDVTSEGKHNKYRFQVNGEEKLFVTASTPSDQRSWMNAVTDLRHVLGVKRKVYKNPKNRQKAYRKHVVLLPKAPKITVRPDPWEKLKEMEVVNICSEPAAQPSPAHRPLRRFWTSFKALMKEWATFR